MMLKLAQMKYSSFPTKVTPSQATVRSVCLPIRTLGELQADSVQMMVRETCYFASDYDEELRQLGTPAALAANTAIVQFPYTEAVCRILVRRSNLDLCTDQL